MHGLSRRTAFGLGPAPVRTCRDCALRSSRTGLRRISMCSSAIAELSDENIPDLMRSAGAMINPAVRVSERSPLLVAQQAISKDMELISLPADVVLSTSSAQAIFGREAKSLSAEAKLAALILHERSRGRESAFALVLRSLPDAKDLHHPYLWNQSELDWLTGSTLKTKVTQVRDGIEDEWEAVSRLVPASASLDDYLWAQAVVSTLAISLGSSFALALAPLVDRPKFGDGAEEFNASISLSRSSFFTKPRVLFTSSSEIAAGEAVHPAFEDSSLTTADYLLDYGTIITKDGVPKLSSSVGLSFALTTLDQFYEDKADILSTNEVELNPEFTISDSMQSGPWTPPDGMEQYLRLLCLSGTDAFLLEGVFSSDVWEYMEFPVSRQNEKQMCDAIIAACEDLLESYHPKPASDQEESNVRARLASLVVEGEKRALQECIAYFDREIQSLDAKEYYQERRLKALDLLRPLDESEIVDSEAGSRMGQSFDENY